MHSNDNPILSVDVRLPRYGCQYHAIKRRIRVPVDDGGRVRSSVFLDSTDELVQFDRSVR